MKAILCRSLLALVPALAMVACVPSPAPTAPRSAPPPASTASPAPSLAPAPTLPREPGFEDYLAIERTAGDWRYRAGQQATSASFGAEGQLPLLVIGCDLREGQVTLRRRSDRRLPAAGRIVSESLTRRIEFAPTGDNAVVARLAPSAPLLDAMAFSRGRFFLEIEGEAVLAPPSWAEMARVIEDCRAPR